MNQILNMVMRLITRKLLNKGIDAGFKKAASLRGGRGQQQQGEIDDFGNPVSNRDDVRAARRAKRESAGKPGGARQAKQAMKMLRRTTKF
jgi:hypothetical protein